MQQSKRGRRVKYNPVQKKSKSKNDIITTYEIKFRENIDGKDILGHMSHAIYAFRDIIKTYRQTHNALKFKLLLQATFEKATDPDVQTDPPVVLHTENFEVYHVNNINEELENAEQQVRYLSTYNTLYEKNNII